MHTGTLAAMHSTMSCMHSSMSVNFHSLEIIMLNASSQCVVQKIDVQWRDSGLLRVYYFYIVIIKIYYYYHGIH